MIRRVALAIAALATTAQIAPPERNATELEIATSAQLAPTLRSIADAYERAHPGQRVRIAAIGSDAAMARFNTNRAELAIIGRTGFDQELKAYEWIFRAPPKATPIFRGSLNAAGHSPALAVRVNAANPLQAVTPAQLAAAFRVGGDAPTWATLGVGGTLAGKRIQIVMPDAESGTGRFMRKAFLNDVVQFDWRRVREEREPGVAGSSGTRTDSFGARIAAAVARDPAALGIGDAAPLKGTRILPVLVDGKARFPGQPGYPFDREILAYSDPRPRANAAAFIAFARSPAARAVMSAGRYRPLD